MTEQKQSELGTYAIYDKKSKKYDTPFFAYSDLFAKRRVILMMDENNSPLNRWSEDFRLDKVGGFDVENGETVGYKEIIFECATYIKKEN